MSTKSNKIISVPVHDVMQNSRASLLHTPLFGESGRGEEARPLYMTSQADQTASWRYNYLDLLGTKIKMEELNQRMIIVGDSGVGKTSFIIRWEREYFSEDGLRPQILQRRHRGMKWRESESQCAYGTQAPQVHNQHGIPYRSSG